MWFGSPPSSSPFPFLKSGFRSVKRRNKLQPKVVRYWYLDPAPNYPRDAMRILCKSDRVFERAFGALCTIEKIRQEFTTADSPQHNGVAERQVAIIEAAGLAARVQAAAKNPNKVLPRGESLWAEQAYWACYAINCTATSANLGFKSLHEMWFGSPPSSSPFPFLKPGFRSVKRRNKLQPKAVRYWYLGPAPNYPRDAMRILCKSGRVVATRHVTWAHVPTHIPSIPQQAILAPGENSSGGDESGEGQAPSPAVKSRPRSSENDGSGGEGHFEGDSTDDVFVYDGVGVSDGLDNLDDTPQKTEENRQRCRGQLRAFNAKRTNRQGSVVEINSDRVSNALSRGGEGNSSLRSRTGGGGRSGSGSANGTVGSGNEPAPTSPSSQDGGEGAGDGREGESAPPSHAPSYSTSTSDSGEGVAQPVLSGRDRRNLEWMEGLPELTAGRTRGETSRARCWPNWNRCGRRCTRPTWPTHHSQGSLNLVSVHRLDSTWARPRAFPKIGPIYRSPSSTKNG